MDVSLETSVSGVTMGTPVMETAVMRSVSLSVATVNSTVVKAVMTVID